MNNWWRQPARAVSRDHLEQARQRQTRLTKPPGSLGRMETLAIQLAGLQQTAAPRLDHIKILVFAADHGIAAEGVSAFPQAVTLEMVRNFARGGAAINVLAKTLAAELEIIDVGTASAPGELSRVRSERIAAGTANFMHEPAMNTAQLHTALAVGRAAVERAQAGRCQLLIGGEMGIANTTSATALACAVLRRPAVELAGPGTGLSADALKHKIAVIDQALALHRLDTCRPWDALVHVGGFEIAALTGAFISAGQVGIPVLVDGFIASVAALLAVQLGRGLAPWLLYAHRSAEPGHAAVLDALHAEPLLDLGMRLGEGSGAALAAALLRQALALHNDMATFAEAGIPGGPE